MSAPAEPRNDAMIRDHVAKRLETLFHSMAAMYEIAEGMISDGDTGKHTHSIVALRDLLRAAARDVENCSEKLSGEELGYFESHFGSI